VMSGSNDYEARTRIYQWIEANQQLIYAPRESASPVGVYFSPKTRNYFAWDYTDSYLGMMSLLMNHHIEFEIITPRTIEKAKNRIILLPDVCCMSADETEMLSKWVKEGKTLIATGETSRYNEKRAEYPAQSLLPNLLKGETSALFIQGTPEKDYFRSLKKCTNDSVFSAGFTGSNKKGIEDLLKAITGNVNYNPAITVQNAGGCITQTCLIKGKPAVFIANFSGLKSRENAVQNPAKDIVLTFEKAVKALKVTMIPFAGQPVELKPTTVDKKLTVHLPEILRGAIVFLE
jgi:hypothetical protein